jgi:O-antigen/teichoic acid export membrane protein
MHFGPVLAADVGSNAVAVLAALPIVLWRRDYSAMLWLLTLQTAVYVSITHLAAKRIYRYTWDRAYVQRILSFGWPLLFNGLLMYGIFQGDRFVIGASGRLFGNSRYTLSDLAVYSVGFSFMMSISMFMISVTSQLFLPLLSRVQVAREQFARRYRGCCYAVCSLSVLAVVPFVLVGGWVIRLVYGPHYAAAGSFVGWIAAMFGVRLLRAAPTLAATALGDTRNALVSNIVRTVGLAGVLAAAAVNGPLWWIAASGFAGEVAALVVCLWRLERQHQVPAKSMVKPVWITSAGCATAGLAARAVGNSGIVVGWACAALIVAATLTALIVATPELCQELGTIITRRSRGKSHDSREWLTPGSTGTQS